jgi:hypothetical protein
MSQAGRELDLVRTEVRKVLEQSQAWQNLAPSARQEFARNMVKVGSYLAKDPGWLDAEAPPGMATAEAMGPVDDLKARLAKPPGQVGAEFQAGAVKQGVEAFGDLVKTVDFPEFVSGLIQGVFQAIVDASIQQMEAYGELLAATAKSVGEFAADHITDDQAREHVLTRYPSVVRMERGDEGGRRLALAEDADPQALQQVARTEGTVDLGSPESEQKFVTAVKLEMARQRQKMMALMVMLGINRIIVTNGKINAKVVFDMRASDAAKRRAQASLEDRESSQKGAAGFVGVPWGGGGAYSKSSHTATVRSSVDDTSASKAEVSARLSGDVTVAFKSETLPPERMLDALQMNQMSALAGGAVPATSATPGAAQPGTGGTAASPGGGR